MVEKNAWEAWEQSTTEYQSTRTRCRSSPGRADKDGLREPGVVEEAELHRETREGDPRWLNIILKCVSQRVALLGLQEPDSLINVVGPTRSSDPASLIY
jgi:hypothetical protein